MMAAAASASILAQRQQRAPVRQLCKGPRGSQPIQDGDTQLVANPTWRTTDLDYQNVDTFFLSGRKALLLDQPLKLSVKADSCIIHSL